VPVVHASDVKGKKTEKDESMYTRMDGYFEESGAGRGGRDSGADVMMSLLFLRLRA